MKIKKWFVGIAALFLTELLLFLVFSIAFPEKPMAGSKSDVIRQSMLARQEEEENGVVDGQEDDVAGEGDSGKFGKNARGDNAAGEGSEGSHQKKQEGKTEREIYQKHKQDLVLVNVEHAIKDSYDPSLRSICGGRLQASERIYSALSQMLSDAGEQGYHFWIASAYRSKERQQKLVDEDVAKAMRQGLSYRNALQETYRETMPAGHSEHQTGLALDILCSGNMALDASQKAEPGNRWLRKHCSQYGFILRYPEKKSNITGVSFEPWHFRYVGKRAAEYMEGEGITLEEFWDRMGN